MRRKKDGFSRAADAVMKKAKRLHTLKIKRLKSPLILRERVGVLEKTIYGDVAVSLPIGRSCIIFEFPNGMYHTVSMTDLAAEVFRQIASTGGSP